VSGLDEPLRQELGRHVRRLRQAQDLTLAALAEQVGVSPSALSQIERGKSEPSLGTLWRLGNVLQASLFDFFAHDRPAPVDVTRASERTVVEFDRLRYEAIAVSARRTIDLFVLRLEPGTGPVRDLVRHPGEEAGVVLSGRLEVLVAGESHELGPGDGIWFQSTEPHTFAPLGDAPCVSVWADTIPREADDNADVWSRSLFDPAAQLEHRPGSSRPDSPVDPA
jgi:transcriptional regulator with XRE-family HTH domain